MHHQLSALTSTKSFHLSVSVRLRASPHLQRGSLERKARIERGAAHHHQPSRSRNNFRQDGADSSIELQTDPHRSIQAGYEKDRSRRLECPQWEPPEQRAIEIFK